MAYGTVNADVIGTSVPGVTLGAGNATVFKNRIINGDMRIDQRNSGASVTATSSAPFTLDRWQAYNSVASSKFTVQQNAGSVTPPIGYTNYLGATSSSAYSLGSGDVFLVYQKIEGLNMGDFGWGTTNAKTVTLSFQVYSSLTGTFAGSIQNSAQNRSYTFSYTIPSANTWTTISVTIPGDTTGTWLTTNGIGAWVFFNIGAGSSTLTTAGAWGSTAYFGVAGQTNVVSTNGATFYITGVQLEVGSSATGFEYVNYTTQLSMCQRYYEILTMTPFGNNLAGAFYGSSTYTITPIFKVTKRTAPTVALGSTASWATTVPNIISPSIDNIYIASTGGGFFLQATAGQPGLTFSAEL